MPLVVVVLVTGTAVAGALALLVPHGRPYDEPAHWSNVLFYARELALPVIGEPGVAYEAQMGPVYYGLSAGVVALFGGVGEASLTAVRVVWLLLVPLCGILTFLLARSLGVTGVAAVVAAAVVVLNPTVLAVSASVQNDTLAMVLATGAGLYAVHILRRSPTGVIPDVLVGALIGLAVLTKVFAGALLIGYLVALWLRTSAPAARRLRRTGALVVSFAVVTGWWFVRNLFLYGDLTGRTALGDAGYHFPSLGFEGMGSVAAWGQNLIAYVFAPTEYYRNAFDAPTWLRIGAVVVTVLLMMWIGFSSWRAARRRSSTVVSPEHIFGVVSVVTAVLVYASAVWTVQAIAPRVLLAVAPLAVALLAREVRGRFGLLVAIAVLVTFLAADVWLVWQTAQLTPLSASAAQ